MSLLKLLRSIMLVGVASLGGAGSLHAQTTFDPLFFCGVVGGGQLTTTEGAVYTFPATERPSRSSVEAHPAWMDTTNFSFGAGLDGSSNLTNLGGSALGTVTEPTFLSGLLEIRDGTTVVGTRECRVVIFPTADQRDAFLYYTAQKEAAASETDRQYFETLADYEFWIGQEEEGVARFVYYSGIAEYYRDTASTPQEGMYFYNYYFGVACYLYFESVGDSESAALSFFYYYDLAVEALEGGEEPALPE